MFDYNEFSINESLAPSIGEYNLVKSPRGNYYRHKDYKKPLPKEWIIESDGFVSVDGDVDYSKKNFKNIPFLFNKVSGDFVCEYCTSLISLKGCPLSVDGSFECAYCDTLTSLEGCPQSIGMDLDCGYCSLLTSLKGCPDKVGRTFYCYRCNFISLEGCPESVGNNFVCLDCDSLNSIDYFKCTVNGNIYADDKILLGLENIQNLYRQYPLLAKIKDYSLFVHTVIGYAPELKQYYKEIPELPEQHQELSTFL